MFVKDDETVIIVSIKETATTINLDDEIIILLYPIFLLATLHVANPSFLQILCINKVIPLITIGTIFAVPTIKATNAIKVKTIFVFVLILFNTKATIIKIIPRVFFTLLTLYLVLCVLNIISFIGFLFVFIIALIVINICNKTANTIPITNNFGDIFVVSFVISTPSKFINKLAAFPFKRFPVILPITPATNPYIAFSKTRIKFIFPLLAPTLLKVPITGNLSANIILFNELITKKIIIVAIANIRIII